MGILQARILEWVAMPSSRARRLEALVPSRDSRARTRSPSPRAWRPGFPGSSAGKESACSARDLGSIPGLGRSPEGGYGNPLQYSCLENPHGQRSLVGYSPQCHKEFDRPCSDSSATPSFPSQPEGKIGLCLVAQSCLALCDPMDSSPPGSSVRGDSPDKNTGVDCHAQIGRAHV